MRQSAASAASIREMNWIYRKDHLKVGIPVLRAFTYFVKWKKIHRQWPALQLSFFLETKLKYLLPQAATFLENFDARYRKGGRAKII